MRINSRIICYLTSFTFIWSDQLCLANSADDTSVNKKPNVLVIFADDVGTGDVPGYWNTRPVIDMPNLESLLKEGTTFTDAHSTPLCAPSRYMFLSGNYQHRGERFPGLWNLNYRKNQFKKDQMSIAEVLRDNGYDTAMFGKWHLGGKLPTKDGFTTKKFYAEKGTLLNSTGHDWTKPMEEGPTEIGFDTSYITAGGLQSPPYAFIRNNTLDIPLSDVIQWEEGDYQMPHGLSSIKSEGEGGKDWDSTAYNMILVNETKAFLDKNKDKSEPFFAYVALGAVHLPNTPPDHFLDGSKVAGEYGTPHMDVLFELDKVVGALIQSLRNREMLEDTIIIFTSDNGGLNSETLSDKHGHYSNGLLRGHKGTLYEGGIRVPLTFRWDNGRIPKGEKRSQLIGLNDLYKTICGLIGIEPPENQAVDSINFSKYIFNENRRAGLREYQGAWMYDSSRLVSEAMRYKEMKLVRSYQNDTLELYNLTADISEVHDISEENVPMVNKIFQKLRAQGPCYDKYGIFQVKTNNRKRSFTYKSCYWFRQKRTSKRCNKFPEAQHYCRHSCGGRNSQYCARDLYSENKLFKIYNNTY